MQSIKRKIRSLFKIIFRLFIDLDILALLRFFNKRKIIFLFYHGVSTNPNLETNNQDGKHVALYKFEQQMSYIKKKYNVVPVDKAIAMLRREIKMIPNTIAVTFDDGYYNNLSCVFPVINKLGIHATIFLSIDYVEKGKNSGFLGWSEISAMHKPRIEYGAHTVTHPVLTQISGDRAKSELRDAYVKLGLFLDKPVSFFAYPYGIFNQHIADLVKEAGYSCAFTTAYGVNTCSSDLYQLKRVAVNNNFTFEYFVANLFPCFRNIMNKIYEK